MVADLADAIVDIVETGATLRANGLAVVEPLATSSARVVANRAAWALREHELAPILSLLEAACGS